MRIEYKVVVIIEPVEKQDKNEFIKEDGDEMKKYLKRSIEERVGGAWRYNARVKNFNVTTVKNKKI